MGAGVASLLELHSVSKNKTTKEPPKEGGRFWKSAGSCGSNSGEK